MNINKILPIILCFFLFVFVPQSTWAKDKGKKSQKRKTFEKKAKEFLAKTTIKQIIKRLAKTAAKKLNVIVDLLWPTELGNGELPPRNEKKMWNKAVSATDKIFYKKHPELKGRKLTSSSIDKKLVIEWLSIFRRQVAIVETDWLFYAQHPELKGRKLTSSSKDRKLVKEWRSLYKRLLAGKKLVK